MGKLVKNKDLNYWLCGFIFAIFYGVVLWVLDAVAFLPILGILIYIIIMPYVTGRLVDYVSDRWMD